MSFLAWVFGLGALAVAFPLIFHLIRRTPRGHQQFSSLMFIKQSPPRITRRSRLDNWLLLILRGLAITLLAVAFMRPFFPQSLNLNHTPGRRVAVLLDVSASMRRGDLWQQALAEVEQVLSDLDLQDDLALIAFDDEVQTVVEFNSPETTTVQQKPNFVRQQLKTLAPSWAGTDLGRALIFAADQLDAHDDRNARRSETPGLTSQLIVISDLQAGANCDALNNFIWPDNVLADFRNLRAPPGGNATLQLLQSPGAQPDSAPRVRVSNSIDASQDTFQVSWKSTAALADSQRPVDFFVQPGTSRVLSVPRPADSNADQLLVTGDKTVFDNVYYTVPLRQKQTVVGYLGDDDVNDANGLQYYLSRALVDTPQQKIEVINDWQKLDPLLGRAVAAPDLVVVTKPLEAAQVDSLSAYLELDKTVLIVLTSLEMTESLAPLIGDLQASEQPGRDAEYRLLGEIDFAHPLFKPLSGPQFNDFTKIRFWRHRAVSDLPETNTVLARFDNGDPAWWITGRDSGSLYVLASGWNPDESQLALSTKFVPLMMELLKQSGSQQQLAKSCYVNDRVALPFPETAALRKVAKPDGSEIVLAPGDMEFDDTDEPGIYQLHQDERVSEWAVNVSPAESKTSPLDIESLAVHEIRMGSQPNEQQLLAQLKTADNVRLESRQKIWKWAIIGVLALVLVETLLASWQTAKSTAASSDTAAAAINA